MSTRSPTVSIGLPVYNGEPYLGAAVRSVLNQTFWDWELIISDNGSTDATPDLCSDYARRDGRIRYLRHESNRGAGWNFNHVFFAARGRYFKWAAADDVLAARYLEKCLAVLEEDPQVVLCYPRVVQVDHAGQRIGELATSDRVESDDPVMRFVDQIDNLNSCEHVFGVMPTEVLQGTQLIGSYEASDRVLLCELALLGRFHQVAEPLFYHRQHRQRFVKTYLTRHGVNAWFRPEKWDHWAFPAWALLGRYLSTIHRSAGNLGVRLRCYGYVLSWQTSSANHLWRDLVYNSRRAYWLFVKQKSSADFFAHIDREFEENSNEHCSSGDAREK